MVFAELTSSAAAEACAASRWPWFCTSCPTSPTVGTFTGNSTGDGSSTSLNVVGPDEKLSSTFCPAIDPVKWNVYFPGAVGKKNASYSPCVPRPVSGSNPGSSARSRLCEPNSTATFRLSPRFVTGLPVALSCRKNCT